ncbi:Cellulose synthase-like protein [Actinidia chinensis var. chinensis]|uniref:Cellulose synthase-like protein n=1 Tax=Actinidia chinensis var. chinensis TaxID=1590841 RepID=A0A2R6P560_ACTCC|nr:Cellulose synthase-like protein [Actinidia chinensis var. chinensis]
MVGHGGGEEECLPLFETKLVKGNVAYKIYAITVFVGICLIWLYRFLHIPRAQEPARWAWIGMFMAELWFGFYWIITQSVRWNVTRRYPFKERLMSRYGDKLPAVDIFVCTADPKIEPPTMVISTILSVMSYNYPPEKLSVYLSDDGGSEFTFYALLEASQFSKQWVPFCKKFSIEPRSPAAYFAQNSSPQDNTLAQEWLAVKKLYEDMKCRIESAIENGSISKDIRDQHTGFSEWNSEVTKQDHPSIVQILIDGRNLDEVDDDGRQLPTLVYLAREKRPHCHHNFKAGSMNALIRVSSEISNAPIILNLDCDMYSNHSDAIQEAVCFFVDEERGHKISYVQYPQCFDNITTNDIYSNVANAVNEIELAGIDGFDGALYCGTGCFHRRESICGGKYSKNHRGELSSILCNKMKDKTVHELEKESKVLANCSYEKDTQWGKEMGLVYGCPVEDIVTGLTIQCRGWKSVYYSPDRKAFLGVAPITLDQALVQYKRWSEGMFQIFLSKYCPFIYAHGKIKLGAQMGYCVYLLWAPNAFPTIYYVIIPSICLLRNVPLFPEVSSLWFLPFLYVFVSRNACSIVEALTSGATLKAWWNSQRMWLIRRTTSYVFAFIDTITRQLGFSQTAFVITAKVVDKDVLERYQKETMEFGSSSVMFTIIATLALLNLFCFVGGIMKIVWGMDLNFADHLVPQIVLCGLVVVVNVPVYQALFVRHDRGRIPSSVTFKSVVLASLVCLMPVY